MGREKKIMKILDILKKDCIITDLTSRSKKDVIHELVDAVTKVDERIDPDSLVEILLEREKLGSTGIGDGVAIPHGKFPNIDTLRASFGRSRQGIDFDALDGKPSHLFFLLVAPDNSAGAHLKALARISRLFKDNSFRENLQIADTEQQLFDIITEEDNKY
jgi:PTS system nitrogen regulatory IIA component